MLLYETTDQEFAEHAVASLRNAGIASYSITSSVLANKFAIGNAPDAKTQILIENAADYDTATQLIISLGAAVDAPLILPSKKVAILIAVVTTALAIFVAMGWKQ